MNECRVCAEPASPSLPLLLLPCLHVVCGPCVADLVAGNRSRCLECREPFVRDALLPAAAEAEAATDMAAALLCEHDDAAAAAVFCETCGAAVCDACAANRHSGCTVAPLGDDAGTLDAKLQAFGDNVDSALVLVTSWAAALRERREQLLAEIDTAYEMTLVSPRTTAPTKTLRTRRNELQRQARVVLDADVKTVELQRDALHDLQQRVAVAQRYKPSASRQRVGAWIQRVLLLLRHTPHLTPVINDNLYFQPMRDNDELGLVVHRREVGELQWAVLEVNLGHPFQVRSPVITAQPPPLPQPAPVAAARKRRRIGRGAAAAVQEPSPPPPPPPPPRASMGVAQLQNGNLLTSHPEGGVQLWHVQDRVAVQLTRMHKPFVPVLAACNDDGFWLGSMQDDGRAQKYSSHLRLLKEFPLRRVAGLAMSANDRVIAAFWERDDQAAVASFTEDGERCWISHHDSFEHLRQVAVSFTEVFVADQKANVVHVLSLHDGQYLRQIGDNHLEKPVGVALLARATHLVVAELHVASVWTLNGVLVHRWGGDIRLRSRLNPRDSCVNHVYPMFHNKSGQATVLLDGGIAIIDSGGVTLFVF